MSGHVEPADDPDVVARLSVLWHGQATATVVIPTVIALTDGELSPRDRLVVAAVAALFLAGHWLVLARHPEWWERRLGPLAAYWTVSCALVTVLALQHQSFVITLYGLYPMMFITLGWWGIVPIVGVTASVGWALGGWGSGQAMIINLLTTAALALLIAVFITAISRQSEQRREALAQLAATRAELAESARQTGVLAERERLARELHDTVAQGFTSVVTQLESAEQALDGRPDHAAEHLAKARRSARDSLAELRRSVQALRPDLLSGAPLTQALEQAVRAWSADTGVPAELRTTGEAIPLHPETELALLRTTQEALTNAARHASASRVVVTLSFLGDTVTLDVDDDGVGFDERPRPRADGGFGLIGMRERIQAAGGELSIESAAGQGTTVAASVPV